MMTQTMLVEDIQPDPGNARLHSERNLEAIKDSLARFGQQKPIVVDEGSVVRAGNGTLLAAKALGWTEIEVVVSSLSDAEIKAFAIADNRTAELASWNEQVLWESITSLGGVESGDLAFTAAEIEAINPNYEGIGDPESAWEGMPEFVNEDKTSYRHIIVHFRSDEDAEDFAQRLGQTVTARTKSTWHPELADIDNEGLAYDES